QVDRRQRSVGRRPQQVLRRRLAPPRRLEAALPQQRPHLLAHLVVAPQRRRRPRGQQRRHLVRRRLLAPPAREFRHQGGPVQHPGGIDGQHGVVIPRARRAACYNRPCPPTEGPLMTRRLPLLLLLATAVVAAAQAPPDRKVVRVEGRDGGRGAAADADLLRA